ncbi:hypothetical protein BGX29_001719 [Mortierella sp. GBA35]|nr:hypothetical protein BGX29_001719 [Mortierella sp. GBA35]
MGPPRRSDSIPSNNNNSGGGHHTRAGNTSSKVFQELLDTVASLTSLSDKDRDSIDTQVKVMMRQIKGAIEELESLEQERRRRQRANAGGGGGNAAVSGFNQLLAAAASTMGASGPVDQLAQHRQGVTLYLNERLASLATLHKDQYEVRIAREMEKRESSLFKALPKATLGGTNGYGMTQRRNFNETTSASTPPLLSSGSSPYTGVAGSLNGIGGNRSDSSKGISSSHDFHSRHGETTDDQDFEQGLSAEERQMLEMENENIVRKLETELNQVRQLETSMIELSTLHSTIQEHLEVQTQQTNRLHEEAQTAINHIDTGNEQLIKAGKRNNSTRKWILFFLILASFVLLFLDCIKIDHGIVDLYVESIVMCFEVNVSRMGGFTTEALALLWAKFFSSRGRDVRSDAGFTDIQLSSVHCRLIKQGLEKIGEGQKAWSNLFNVVTPILRGRNLTDELKKRYVVGRYGLIVCRGK